MSKPSARSCRCIWVLVLACLSQPSACLLRFSSASISSSLASISGVHLVLRLPDESYLGSAVMPSAMRRTASASSGSAAISSAWSPSYSATYLLTVSREKPSSLAICLFDLPLTCIPMIFDLSCKLIISNRTSFTDIVSEGGSSIGRFLDRRVAGNQSNVNIPILRISAVVRVGASSSSPIVGRASWSSPLRGRHANCSAYA